MSFSFTITADTKEEFKQKVDQSVTDYVGNQESHSVDVEAIRSACLCYAEALSSEKGGDDHEYHMYAYGSVSWRYDKEPKEFTAGQVSITASIRKKS